MALQTWPARVRSAYVYAAMISIARGDTGGAQLAMIGLLLASLPGAFR